MRLQYTEDEKFMKEALRQAKKAAEIDEVPIGCVIVYEGKIIARGYNQRNKKGSTLAHAEILAIQKASKALGDWRLEGCTMYVTLEPCCMCAMALVHARLKEVVFGAYDPKTGACGSMLHLINDYKHNHKVLVRGGVMKEQCASVLSQFFARRREEKKAEKQDKANQANQD